MTYYPVNILEQQDHRWVYLGVGENLAEESMVARL